MKNKEIVWVIKEKNSIDRPFLLIRHFPTRKMAREFIRLALFDYYSPVKKILMDA